MAIRRGVYPGSFDPAHFGHIDIVTRAARVFEEVYVAVYDRPAKKLLFNVHERVAMLEKSLHALSNVKVASYSGLLCEKDWRVCDHSRLAGFF